MIVNKRNKCIYIIIFLSALLIACVYKIYTTPAVCIYPDKVIPEDEVSKVNCEEEELYGSYRDYCDCGFSGMITLKAHGKFEYKESSENTDCYTYLNWEKHENHIRTVYSGYTDVQLIQIIKDFPVNKRLSVTLGHGFEEFTSSKNRNNSATEKVLVNDDLFSRVKKSGTYFFKIYNAEYFDSLRCPLNRNRFLKRMIYSDMFFFNNEEAVIKFLQKAKDKNLDYDVKDVDGVTALHAAVDLEFKRVAEMLLKLGANPNIKNSQGYTPLKLAKQNGLKEIAELLKKHGGKE